MHNEGACLLPKDMNYVIEMGCGQAINTDPGLRASSISRACETRLREQWSARAAEFKCQNVESTKKRGACIAGGMCLGMTLKTHPVFILSLRSTLNPPLSRGDNSVEGS
jgi:hypothetical protein